MALPKFSTVKKHTPRKRDSHSLGVFLSSKTTKPTALK